MLFTIVAIATALASISIHELGHAIAMRQSGVRVLKISLLGIPGLGTIHLPIVSRFFPGTQWRVHPFIVGAYVEPEKDDMENLSRRDTLYVYGMGPLMNILFTLTVAFLLVTFTLALDLYARSRGVVMPWRTQVLPFMVAAFATLIIALWYYRRLVCQFVLLPLGWFFTMMILYAIFTKTGRIAGLSDVVGDIHSAGPSMMKGMPQSVMLEVTAAIIYGSFLSFILGVANLLPIVPLDGGHMMRIMFPAGWRNVYAYATAPLFAVLIILQFGKDIYNLVRWMFW